MPTVTREIRDQVLGTITDALREQGADLKDAGEAVRQYAATRATHLAAIVGEPGDLEAAKAEAQNVLLFAAQRGIEAADAVDARLQGLVQGVMATAARLVLA